MIQANTRDLRDFAGDLAHVAASSMPHLERAVSHNTSLLRTRVLARASGRPGPRAPTGDYRRSWTPPRVAVSITRIKGWTGTNAPQAWRLEKGFVGRDAIGRYYNQPPYEHAAPAVDDVQEGFLADTQDAFVTTLVRGLA